MNARRAVTARLSRKEWALLTLGLGVWIALGSGAVWLVHELNEPRQSCNGNGSADPQPTQAKGSITPGRSFNMLTGRERCK